MCNWSVPRSEPSQVKTAWYLMAIYNDWTQPWSQAFMCTYQLQGPEKHACHYNKWFCPSTLSRPFDTQMRDDPFINSIAKYWYLPSIWYIHAMDFVERQSFVWWQWPLNTWHTTCIALDKSINESFMFVHCSSVRMFIWQCVNVYLWGSLKQILLTEPSIDLVWHAMKPRKLCCRHFIFDDALISGSLKHVYWDIMSIIFLQASN